MKQTILTIVTVISFIIGSADAGQARSQTAIRDFKQAHPCPTNGNTKGACPGYVIDHIEPLACGGADAPTNMQWQTTADAKAKDKWERSDCPGLMDVRGRRSSSGFFSKRKSTTGKHSTGGSGYGGNAPSAPSGSGNYHIGPRGGCYTYNGSGKKQYVDHSYCS
ncbi:HNH endonuclease [Methylomonas koyamae]|uniref:HNH endonuclease signature motif containing protein n=1 Tax=Methylomonas koyamae TaxID=702114 RepID=UPI001642F4A6|nr:HNH endonuclease [Methylomonas koyamae]